MRKIILSIFICLCFQTAVIADNFPPIKYKNIGKNAKISYNNELNQWSYNVDKKLGDYFVKTKGFSDFYDYLDAKKNLAFTTDFDYEFIYKDKFIGYSNKDFNFYEFSYVDGTALKTIISPGDVQDMLPEYKIIRLSDFSENTNSIKIKKHISDLRILVLNDSGKDLSNYVFTTGNAKFKTYKLNGFITVTKPGMIQFAPDGGAKSAEDSYVILVR